MIKIKISHERPEELQEVLKRLAPQREEFKGAVWKQDGRFLRHM